jgi:aspartyl/asparaginyl-tRNA synthetase
VIASGTLVASPGSKQAVEIKADKVTLIGACDPESYPLQKVSPHKMCMMQGAAFVQKLICITWTSFVKLCSLKHMTHVEQQH